MPVRRHFLPWDRPLLAQAVAFLAEGWNGSTPLDLSKLMVIVPTRQAGRRLREALAAHAHEKNQAVFPPRIGTPDALLALHPDERSASPVESLLAWSEVFRELPLPEFRDVFPVDPPARDFAWALRIAVQFQKLQASLAEGGLRLGSVVARAGEDFPEAERWRQLGALEQRYDEKLLRLGRRDLQAAKLAAAAAPPALPGIERIAFLAVPDPFGLAISAAEARQRELPVEVVVFAPPSEEPTFDDWGRPRSDVWARRTLALEAFERRVHLCADPSAQADRMAAWARAYGASEGMMAIGVADPEVGPLLESALRRVGCRSFDPEGRLRRRDGLFPLLSSLAALAREPDFDAVAILARCPDFLRHLARRIGEGFSAARWLQGLDELQQRALPADLDGARAAAAAGSDGLVAPALGVVAEIRALLVAGSFADGASAVLTALFDGQRLELSRPEEEQRAESARAWTEILRDCAAAGPDLPPAEGWDLAIRLFGETRAAGEKAPGAFELQGWLELLWEDAPHLAVAGCNDGKIPTAVVGDPFLPEVLRERLGLHSNAGRYARDAYVLAALAACRADTGRLDLLLGKTSVAGEPLRPSRLLLACPDAELPARAQFLFRPAPPARPSPPWRRAWRLRAPGSTPLRRMSVTAFRDYLRCPFRFYLKHALGWSAFDPQKSELDALDFGNLCHAALEAMAALPALRHCTDPATLRDFLAGSLEDMVSARYGRRLTLPLAIQLESARQRLGRAAEVQAQQRREGWVITRMEDRFRLAIGGMEVTGKFDRFEEHAESGRRRVLDYKTSDRSVTPEAAHFRKERPAGESAPEFARFRLGGSDQVWTDLQLPLYLEALSDQAIRPAAGYFNLPRAVGGTAVVTWRDYSDEIRAAARRCAEGVVAAVRAGIFYPPAELNPREDGLFEGLFHQGAAESVEPVFAAGGGGRP